MTPTINLVCNPGVTDSEIIERLGGSTVLTRRLGYKKAGAQGVNNWKTRGIPARVKLQWPGLFLGPRNEALSEPSEDASKQRDA